MPWEFLTVPLGFLGRMKSEVFYSYFPKVFVAQFFSMDSLKLQLCFITRDDTVSQHLTFGQIWHVLTFSYAVPVPKNCEISLAATSTHVQVRLGWIEHKHTKDHAV